MEGWRDGEMGRWGDGGMGGIRTKRKLSSQFVNTLGALLPFLVYLSGLQPSSLCSQRAGSPPREGVDEVIVSSGVS